MSDPGKAVFLSYASQDAAAAKRICDALRAAGVEVWFDQNELVGGDAWDQKIRRQIKECALLIPIISASTNARAEGYFRLEWRLADQRTHLMGRNRAFLLPVTIDGTSDADADVPDSFTAVQWTKAPGGEVPPAFVARVGKLLAGDGQGARGDGRETRAQNVEPGHRNLETRARWLAPVVAGLAVAAIALVFTRPWEKSAPPVSGLPSPAVNAAPAAPLSPARELAERARAILAQSALTRAQLDTASELCERALKLDTTDPIVWAVAARADVIYLHPYGYDRSPERRRRAQERVERAISLAPDLFEVRVAQAMVFAHAVGTPALQAEAEKTLRELAASRPGDTTLAQQLAEMLRAQGRFVDAARVFEGYGEYEVAGWSYMEGMEFRSALAVAGKARRTVTSVLLRAILEETVNQDLAAAQAVIDELKPSELLPEMPACVAIQLAMYRRQPGRMLEIAAGLSQEYLDSNSFRGPKRFFTGLAHEMAGRPAAAATEWRAALLTIEGRLKTAPDDRSLLMWSAWLYAALNDTAEAERLLARGQALAGRGADEFDDVNYRVLLRLRRTEGVLAGNERILRERPRGWQLAHAEMRFSPLYDLLLDDPRWLKLLRDNLPPGAKPFAVVTADKTQGPDPSNPPPADSKSIAVLPFASLSTDKDNEFFADGVHDEVITNLAKIRDLKVISRSSVLAYRDPAGRNPKKIAAELGVATVLEGNIRRAGNKVRLTAQLTDARNATVLWAENFEGDASDIFALQAELAQKIAVQLKATLTADEKSLIERRPTNNPEAYEAYLRGRVLEERLTQNSRIESYEESIRAYQQAVELDPTFALAYARLTRLHGTVYWFGYLDPTPARKALVEAAVAAAQRNAPNSPETHFARGVLEYFVHTNWERALAEYRLAEAGLPNDIQLQYLIAFTHRRLGHWAEALDYMQRSLARGPRDLYVTSQIGAYYRALRRYDDAIDAGRRCIALFPQDSLARSILALSQFEKDNNLPAYLQALAKVPVAENDPHGLQAAYQQALLTGDLAAADRALADPRMAGVTDPWVAVLTEPVAFHRARVAWLRGDPAAAKQFAEDAIAEFNRRAWTPRQRVYVAVAVCEANAYAGRGDAVLRDLPAAVTAAFKHDAYGSRVFYEYAGQAYLVLGRREDAIAMLRALMTGPSFKSPNTLRIDPFWSRLKDDPRFEEILKSAKPL